MAFANAKENELSIEKELGNVKYRLKMFTPEFMTFANVASTQTNAVSYQNEMKFYKDKLNFVLVLEDVSGSNRVKNTVFNVSEYAKVLAYANSELTNDVKLVKANDTLQASIVYAEPSNAVQPVIRLSLGFSGLKSTDDEMTLIFNDNIFNNGYIKFSYSKRLLRGLPEPKI